MKPPWHLPHKTNLKTKQQNIVVAQYKIRSIFFVILSMIHLQIIRIQTQNGMNTKPCATIEFAWKHKKHVTTNLCSKISNHQKWFENTPWDFIPNMKYI
jgi:hypothetical protein